MSSPEVEIATVSLPDGLRPWWESTHRSAPFGGELFLLAASSDVATGARQPNVQMLRLDSAFEWSPVEVSIPAAVTSADLFMTGSRLAVSYLAPGGEIVFLTSADGTTFDETRLPVPDRYVAADTWAATSLIGSIAGAADLGGEVFAVVDTGVLWRRPMAIAADYAVEQEQDPEVAEAIRFASIVRSKPVGDGDTLFVFEEGGKVVAEVLGSDAGIEAGYIAAYNSRGDDTSESQSWMIDGSTSRNLDTPPFGGREEIRIHALYPVDGGVAAMITDINLGAEQAEAFGTPGIYAAGASVALAGYSTWDLRTMVTFDGLLWVLEALLGVPNPTFGSLAWATYGGIPFFVLVFSSGGESGVATSADGSTWSKVDGNFDPVGPVDSVQALITGENTAHLRSSADGQHRDHKVENSPSGAGSISLVGDSDAPKANPGGQISIVLTQDRPLYDLEPDDPRQDPVDLFIYGVIGWGSQ